MVSQSETLLLVFIFIHLFFFSLREWIAVWVFISSILVLTNCSRLGVRLEGRIEDGLNFREQGRQVGPGVCIFFRKEGLSPEDYLKGSDVGEDDILVGVGVDILVLCDFEGYEMGGDHIADDFELGNAMR